MSRVFHYFSAIATTVGILAVGAVPARAGLDIDLSLDGVTYNTVASTASGPSTSVSYSNTNYLGSGFSITTLSTGNNNPGTSTLALLAGSNTIITNTNTSGTATLYITLGDTDFTAPTTPPNLTLRSHVGGTVAVADASNTLAFQSYVDSANGQNTQTGFTSSSQTPDITGGSFSSDASTTITNLTTTFSMTQSFVLTLSAGSTFNFSSSTTLQPQPAVPEPATIGLALMGLAPLGVVGLRRLRRRPVGV